MRKRITSLLLVLALCLTLLPTAALAEASSLAAQEARGGTENGEDYTVGEDTAVRAKRRPLLRHGHRPHQQRHGGKLLLSAV